LGYIPSLTGYSIHLGESLGLSLSEFVTTNPSEIKTVSVMICTPWHLLYFIPFYLISLKKRLKIKKSHQIIDFLEISPIFSQNPAERDLKRGYIVNIPSFHLINTPFSSIKYIVHPISSPPEYRVCILKKDFSYYR
jgi:hypothetical protein